MTGGPYVGAPDLTEEQLAVVEQAADAKVLVTAGAGAGKTHTLVRRVEALMTDHGLSTGDILILTFTNAAVRELTERLSKHEGRSRHVRVTTFDSWALEILGEVAADVDWRTRSFDERIREATRSIQDERTAPEWLDEVRHLVIDEVQDLVGDRRELIEVLLEVYDCGFTVVGDPAQAIFGFQVLDDDERAIETNRFFDWLRGYFAEELMELSLTRDFRARTAEARTARRFEKAVRVCTQRADADQLYEELRAELAALMDFGDISVPFIRDALGDTTASTAVLCRTNGEALLISEWLRREGLDHRLRRAAQVRVAPAWLNELLLANLDASVLTRQRFAEIHPSLVAASAEPDPDHLWRLLRSCAGDRAGRSLDPSRLREAIALGRLPDALTAQAPHPLVVSTFHRAKGLEFDRVLVVDPGPFDTDDQLLGVDMADQARALYVAMTRARYELYRLNLPEDVSAVTRSGLRLVRRDRRSGRWARFGHQPWQRLGMELVTGDIHTQHPAGCQGFEGNAPALQNYLRDHVRSGDEVALVRCDGMLEDHENRLGPGYAVAHGDRLIGLVSTSFRHDMYRLMQQSHRYEPRNWPLRVTGLRLDTTETVAGDRGAGMRAGLGDLGVWLAPRPIGLGRFHYDTTDKG